MFSKPRNERLAIGTFVGVLAFNAVLTSPSGTHTGLLYLLLIVNAPGVLFITVLAPLLARLGGEQAGLLGAVIACLFSAIFWSFIFGYVLRFKRAA